MTEESPQIITNPKDIPTTLVVRLGFWIWSRLIIFQVVLAFTLFMVSALFLMLTGLSLPSPFSVIYLSLMVILLFVITPIGISGQVFWKRFGTYQLRIRNMATTRVTEGIVPRAIEGYYVLFRIHLDAVSRFTVFIYLPLLVIGFTSTSLLHVEFGRQVYSIVALLSSIAWLSILDGATKRGLTRRYGRYQVEVELLSANDLQKLGKPVPRKATTSRPPAGPLTGTYQDINSLLKGK